MRSRRWILKGAAGFALAPTAFAQAPVRGADIEADIVLLRDVYESLHPGLYRYATKAEMDSRFEALSREWRDASTLAESYLSLSRFLAGIRCGHSYANFYNQTETVQRQLFEGPRLPFTFTWTDSRMVVLAEQGAGLERGTEVVRVDGYSTESILDALMPYARADGGNDAKRRALLEVRGGDGFETFDIFYGLVFKPGSTVRLEIRRPGADLTETRDFPTIDLATRRGPDAGGQVRDRPLWTLSFPQPQAALLTMPTWAVFNSSWGWRAFLDESFATIAARDVDKLVVDLRGNEGGLDCGDDIIARLIDAPLAVDGYEQRMRYQKTPERLNPYLDTWDNGFRDLTDRVEPIGNGFYRQRPGVGDASAGILPMPPRFRGEVAVLIGPSNSSATFNFARKIQVAKLGRLIGGPTGGNLRGINGGAFFFLRLPKSGLEVDVPLIGGFPREPRPDSGILPDLLIEPDAADIAQGGDPVLEAALA